MSERTVEAGRAIAHSIYAPIDRWTESDALDPMFEKPQTALVVRNKTEAVLLDSTSIALSLLMDRFWPDHDRRPLAVATRPTRLHLRLLGDLQGVVDLDSEVRQMCCCTFNLQNSA